MRYKFLFFIFAFFLIITSTNLVSAVSDSYTLRFIIPSPQPTLDNLQNHTTYVNASFTYDLDATDTDGIDCFVLNDTSTFNINCSGYIENVTALDTANIYHLNVTVNDTLNNIASGVFWINVTELLIRSCDGITDRDLQYGTDTSPFIQLCYAIKFSDSQYIAV